jgi:two-component system alkaline phosphatase synthesis response regulator PhoP
MKLKYLTVDSNAQLAERESAVWVKTRNIGMVRVENMTEGINNLLSRKEYLFVCINGDDVDFLPLLKVMRNTTIIPILITTGNFTTKMEVAALANGADLYCRWHETTEDNISSVLAHVQRISEQRNRVQKVLINKKLLIVPSLYQLGVYIGNNNIPVTLQEFKLIKYLMENKWYVLPYGEIYTHVWEKEYKESEQDALKHAVKRLRDKLNQYSEGVEYITTVRDVGFYLEPDNGQ